MGKLYRARVVLVLGVGAFVASYAPAAQAQQTCTSGPFVNGMDVADGNGTIDWSSVAADTSADIGFVYMKATQGNYDDDTTFADNWAGAKGANIVRGAYHFLDPTISGVTQANYFVAAINAAGGLEATDLPPMLDIECPEGNDEPDSDDCLGIGSSGDATGAAITTVMNDWLTTVQAATGRTPIIYSSGDFFTGDNIDTTGLQSYPLFIAYPTTSDCFNYMAPWSGATLWQYDWMGTVDGVPGTGTVDLDHFLGTKADLTAFIGTGVTPIVDAGAPVDAGDAGVPCTISAGDMGVCMLTSTCATLPDGVSTPGFCPGADDIQCCTWTHDDAGADAGPDATVHTDAATGSGSGSGSGGTQADSGTPIGETLDGGPATGTVPTHDASADGATPADDANAPSTGGCSMAAPATGGRATDLAFLLLAMLPLRRRRRGTQLTQ